MRLLLCVIVAIANAATHTQVTDSPFTLTKVAPNVWAAISNNKSKTPAGGNGGFVIGDNGVVVIDTFATADAAKQLLGEIRKLTQLPVKFVVNTHYHADHALGNGVFQDAGATLVAHMNTRRWVHPENLKLFGPGIKAEQKAMIEAIRLPTLVYDKAINLHLGGREVQVMHFPGHTGGDSVVVIADAKVVFGGDLIWRNTVPNTIDASTKPWITTLDTLAKAHSGFTFVPGHGEVGTTEDVVAFRDYLSMVQKLVADARTQGKSGDAIVQVVKPLLTDKYGQWEFFAFLAEPNIREADAELSGTKRIPK